MSGRGLRRAGHDLRIWGEGLACPRCGHWGVEHLYFEACGARAHARWCAPDRFPDAAPPDPVPAAERERFKRSHTALCGSGEYPRGIFEFLRARGAVQAQAGCAVCRSRFAALPLLPAIPHDARLPRGGGAACATCGIAAADAPALGAACDGGRAIRAIANRRAGRSRPWLPEGYASRRTHLEAGCRSPRARSREEAFLIGACGLTFLGRRLERARITCIPCVRALARQPAIPA